MTTKKRLTSVLNQDLGEMTFGSFLRGARASKDKSQVEMADFLGISRSTLCDIEKGRQFVSPALAAKIARKCGLSEIVAVETALMDQIRRADLKLTVEVKPGGKAA